MTDIIIMKGRNGRASVYGDTEIGRRFIKKHMDPGTYDLRLITVPNELADELKQDLLKIDGSIFVEIR